MIFINDHLSISDKEIEFKSLRSSGPGGQHVNKVETAIQLKFDVIQSSLPQEVKEKIIQICGTKVTTNGTIIIKSEKWRSQQRNKEEALIKLKQLLTKALQPVKNRKATKPSKSAKEKRLKLKKKRSEVKMGRKNVTLN